MEPGEAQVEGDGGLSADGWQRLSPWALLFLFLNGLQQFVRQNLAAFAGAGAGFAFVDWLGLRELALAGVAVVLVALMLTLAYHRRFRFRLESDAVRVRRGIFEHKELRVRFDRVQNVTLSQPFYLRPFRLVRFSLETPGASKKEVELPGIGIVLAESMRTRIAEYAGGQEADSPGDDDPEESEAIRSADSASATELYRAGTGALFLHGLTGNQVWIALGAVAGVYGTMERRINQLLSANPWIGELAERLDGPLDIAAAAGVMFLVLLLAAGVLSVIRFHDFSLARDVDRYRARFGLLDTREKTLKAAKIQGLELVQTALGRPLGRWYLVGRQTGAQASEAQSSAGRFVVPALDRRSVLPAAGWLGLPLDRWPAWQPIAPEFRRVFWLRWTLILLAVASVLYFSGAVPRWAVALVVLVNLILLGLIWIRWRWWGWHRDGNRLMVRRGLVGQRIDRFEIDRVQQVQVTRNIIQRRRGLATLVLRLPHGEVRIPYIALETATGLANLILFRAETAPSHEV